MSQQDGTGVDQRHVMARLGWAGAALLIGLLLCAGTAAAWAAPLLLGAAKSGVVALAVGFTAGITLIVTAGALLRQAARSMTDPEKLQEPERSNLLFGRYLVGIGFALLLTALINVVFMGVLAGCYRSALLKGHSPGGVAAALRGDDFDARALEGFAASGSPASVEALGRLFGHNLPESILILALLVISTLVALLGALFFFSTSLWTKMGERQQERFDHSLFWGGLWFRIGEAVLFNLVFFLLFRLYAPDQYLLLPLLSLLIGMFLKSGEQLISGLATRLFAAVSQLLPLDKGLPVALKVHEKPLPALPTDPAKAEKEAKAIEEAIKAIAGVEDARIDLREPRTFRALFDPGKTSAEQINLRLRMLGV